LGLGANVGRPVAMRQLMDAELGARMSPKHAKLPGRATKMARHHHRVDCGRRPQGGDAAAPGGTRDGFEIEPDGWAVFSTDDLSTQLVC
jgi:hypothetical protein